MITLNLKEVYRWYSDRCGLDELDERDKKQALLEYIDMLGSRLESNAIEEERLSRQIDARRRRQKQTKGKETNDG